MSDLISIETVIEWLKTKDIIKLFSQEETARKELKALSSVKQEPKTGHWINDEDTIGCYYCSECGGYVASYDDAYCRYCGAKMIEQKESEE